MSLRTVILVPTWLLAVLVKPFFPPAHPWHNKRITLRSWSRFATPLSVAFGGALWLQSVTCVVGTWAIVHRQKEAVVLLALMNLCFAVWFFSKLYKKGL